MKEIQGLKKINANNTHESKIYLVKGDISEERLGLDPDEYNFLLHNVAHIIHTAADLRLNIPLNDLRKVNVQGTLNLLEFALVINKNHKIERFSFYPPLTLQVVKKISYLSISLQMNMDS